MRRCAGVSSSALRYTGLLLQGPMRICRALTRNEVSWQAEGDRPVDFLAVRHHQRVDVVRVRERDAVADFQAVHGGVDHGRQVAPDRFEGLADRARGERHDCRPHRRGAARIGRRTSRPNCGSGRRLGADLQQRQVADQRHPPIRIAQVVRLETRAAQRLTRVGSPRAQVGVEAIDEARQIDGRRRDLGGDLSFRRHWRDLATLWRSISRPPSLCRLVGRHAIRPPPAVSSCKRKGTGS